MLFCLPSLNVGVDGSRFSPVLARRKIAPCWASFNATPTKTRRRRKRRPKRSESCSGSFQPHRLNLCRPPFVHEILSSACTCCNHRTPSYTERISQPWRLLPSPASKPGNGDMEFCPMPLDFVGKHSYITILARMHTSILGQVRHARGAVMAANEAAIEMRRAARQREKEEVESILAYQAMKVSVRVWKSSSPPRKT